MKTRGFFRLGLQDMLQCTYYVGKQEATFHNFLHCISPKRSEYLYLNLRIQYSENDDAEEVLSFGEIRNSFRKV